MRPQPGFEDIDETQMDFGSLSGPGVSDHYRAKATQASDGSGLHVECNCQYCPGRTRIDIPWVELIICAAGIVPEQMGWRYDEATMTLTPNVGCSFPNCRRELPVRFTPDMCARYVQSGISAGYFTAQQVAAVQQQARGGQRR